jgi:hypothetical protein
MKAPTLQSGPGSLREQAGVTAMMFLFDFLFFCFGSGFLFGCAQACIRYSRHTGK